MDEIDQQVVESFKQQFFPIRNAFDDDGQYIQVPSLTDEVRVHKFDGLLYKNYSVLW